MDRSNRACAYANANAEKSSSFRGKCEKIGDCW